MLIYYAIPIQLHTWSKFHIWCIMKSAISHICIRYNIIVIFLLHWVHKLDCKYDMSLALMPSCTDIWSTKIINQIFVLIISLCFHICVKHCPYFHVVLLALTCFTIGNHVNKDTLFVCSAIQVFITLQHCSLCKL